MVESVDTTDLKSVGITSFRGSSPLAPIRIMVKFLALFALLIAGLFVLSPEGQAALLVGLYVGISWASWVFSENSVKKP